MIREYTPNDLTACLELFDGNEPEYFHKSERQPYINWLTGPKRGAYFVLEEAGKIIAAGGVYFDEKLNSAGLSWGLVDRPLHRKGYGTILTNFRLEYMDAHYSEFKHFLETSQYTYKFYERQGFKVTRTTPNGFGNGIDKVEMGRVR